MTVSVQECTAQVVGGSQVLPVMSGSVTLDEAWSPFAQATLELAWDPVVAPALDPREDTRVRVTLERHFGAPFTLAQLTASVGGTTASWTADLAGQTLAAWTGRFGSPYNATGPRPSQRRVLDLGVRSRPRRFSSGTMTVTLASDEALLQDMALIAADARAPLTATIRAAVTMVLGSIGAVLMPGDDDAPLEVDALFWQPGQSAWDYISPLVDAAGLRLWCDEARQWWLDDPVRQAAGASVTLTDAHLVDLDEELSRDGGWYDAVVIRYRWRDSSDVERTRVDAAYTAGASRVLTRELSRPWPGDGAAAALLARARGRGRVHTATAPSNVDVAPGQGLAISAAGEPVQTGTVARVTWDLGTAEMQVRSRDLVDTPASAWARLPAGRRWIDSPTGGSWKDEVL